MKLSNEEILWENNYLNETIEEIRQKISILGQELYTREEKVKEFQKFMWDSKHDMDPTEMKSFMSQNDTEITLMLHKGKYLQKLYRIQNKPYFGSIIFDDNKEKNKIYIGITHVEKEEEEKYLVHDWRAPISSLFYDYEIGKAKYKAPGGEIEGEIINKRQYTIEEGVLKGVFDNNINIDDEVLQQVLAQESSDKMKNIVNTIQSEQNAIIRNVEDKNLIVQGIAGSGKTSVALHRIAFLLYKIEELSSNNVLIFSPNQIFTEYISNVLPELGEDNTMQTTFHEFLSSQLQEFKYVESFSTFIEKYYKNEEINTRLVAYKQGDKIIKDLDEYLESFLKKLCFVNDIITKDFEVTKEELNDWLKERYSKLLLLDRIECMIEKICNTYYDGKKGKKATIKSLLMKNLNMVIDYKEIFKSFFASNIVKESFGTISELEIKKAMNKKYINYEDACILVYLKGKLEGFNYRGTIKEVVIDEAQDYNKLQYVIIRNIFKKSGFTLLGDINQTINPYYKYNSLEELKEIFKTNTKYIELSKTYRSSPEIIEYTNKILNLNHVSAIRRDNHKPVILRTENNLKEQLIKDLNTLRKEYKSVAIITKTDVETEKVYDLLKEDVTELNMLNSTTKEFNKNLVVIPSYIAKGLEFDSTIIYTTKENQYKDDERNLFYVACTRSQHQLIIYNQ